MTSNYLAVIDSFKAILIKEGRALSDQDLETVMRQELLSMKADITVVTNRESMTDESWKSEAPIEERITERIGLKRLLRGRER